MPANLPDALEIGELCLLCQFNKISATWTAVLPLNLFKLCAVQLKR